MNKPNDPEELITLNPKNYSFWADMKVNGWLLVAMLTGAANALLFHSKAPYGLLRHYYQDWPVVLRAVVELVPLLASLLWARSMARWIRGMDELHQRITQAAFLFATVAYLVLSVIWDLLRRTDIFEVIHEATHLHFELMPFSNCTFAIGMTYVLFGIGYTHIFNRRYQ